MSAPVLTQQRPQHRVHRWDLVACSLLRRSTSRRPRLFFLLLLQPRVPAGDPDPADPEAPDPEAGSTSTSTVSIAAAAASPQGEGGIRAGGGGGWSRFVGAETIPTGTTAGGGGGGTGDSARRAARRRCSCGVRGGGRRARKLKGKTATSFVSPIISHNYQAYHYPAAASSP